MSGGGCVRRITRTALIVLLALGLSGVVTSGAEARPASPPVPVLDWQPCGSDHPGFECTTAIVPLDYDHPRGRTTQLALAKRPAGNPAIRIGTVFVNPGGPGGSGVNTVLNGFGEFLGDNLGGRFDVVGFDPRGVGASDPMHCFESAEESEAFFASQPIFPYLRRQERPYFRQYRQLARECLDDRQSVIRHMSTADVARDMDLLRRAVGDAKLTYLGFSYGSYLGNTYANLFPHKVRALVIDGVLDPRLWSSGWQVVSDRVATQEVFDEFLRLCGAAGEQCTFYEEGGAAARWDAVAESLRRQPLVFPDGTQYGYDFLIADATGALYVPEVWSDFATFLDLVADATLVDATLAEKPRAAALASLRSKLLGRLTADTQEADYPNGFEAYYGNQCADTEYPARFGAYRAIGDYAERGSQFGPYWWWPNAGCAAWPTAHDRYTRPWTARTSSPVLVVGNFFDPATDYAGAKASDRLLRNSRLLSYAGWGHTAYRRSECARGYIDGYLLSGALPPTGTICPANPNPFLNPAAQTSDTPSVMVGLPSLKR